MQEFFEKLATTDYILLDSSRLLSTWSVCPVTGGPKNVVLRLFWRSKGTDWTLNFSEEGLKNAFYDEDRKFYLCQDTDGEQVTLELLRKM